MTSSKVLPSPPPSLTLPQAGPWTPEAAVEDPEAVRQQHCEFLRAGFHLLRLRGQADQPWQQGRRHHRRGGRRNIGGCCGFKPYHIRAVAEELDPERGTKAAGSETPDRRAAPGAVQCSTVLSAKQHYYLTIGHLNHVSFNG